MAALQRVSLLPQNSSSACSIAIDRNPRSFSSSPAFRSVAATPGTRISVSSLLGRNRIAERRGLWRADLSGEGRADSTEEKAENSSATSVASPGEAKPGGGGGVAKGFGAPPKTSSSERKPSSSGSGSRRRAPPSKPLIGVSAADKQTQQVETAVVASLAFLFAVILLEGLLLAASGFLPEEWDEFAVNFVYPAFTPSVGVFLAIAASYGLWKYLGGGTGTSSR